MAENISTEQFESNVPVLIIFSSITSLFVQTRCFTTKEKKKKENIHYLLTHSRCEIILL